MGNNTSDKVMYKVYQNYVLTHVLTPIGPIPTVLDTNGVYPYVSYCETSNRPVLKKYNFIVLENHHVKVTVCPDLGGKVTSMIHKSSGKEVLYAPEVIRHSRILPRFYFVAGGIEVSFPISHSPVQNEKVCFKIEQASERIYLTCGERELRYGMQWSVEYSLGPDDNFLTQRAIFYNPGTMSYPWMSWSNAAMPSAPDTMYHFPRGKVLSHSSKMDTLDWELEGPKSEADIHEMTGYFWENSDVNAFGAFTPSLGSGLYHIADETIAPGIKLWSYGSKEDREWAVLSTMKRQSYIEIQGGPIRDQSIRLELKPKEMRWHAEYWLPSDKVLDIYSLVVPTVTMRPVNEIPLFQWARNEEVKVWIDLLNAHQGKKEWPAPPEIHLNLWPPSGMENMDAAFEKVIDLKNEETSDLWRFYYGIWLTGRGDVEKAIAILVSSNLGLAKIVLSRLLKMNDDKVGAVKAIESVQEPWLQLHPQVVIERDIVLRNMGKHTIAEREKWLSKVDAMNDEWIIERKIQLMIDCGEYQEAKKLLLSVPFQRVHQTYNRTGLWNQICKHLNEPSLPIPKELGEDRLAAFGAYREFREFE